MDDLQFEDTGNLPLSNTMQQRLQMKLGKSADIQKTPSRGGLQSLTFARKPTSSVMKTTISTNVGFEIFQDEQEDIVLEEQQPLKQKEIEKTPCSPIDTVDRYQTSDGKGRKNVCVSRCRKWWGALSRTLFPKVVEVEEMAKLGVEVWDKYPPIDPASRIADDFKYTIRLDELCDHVIDDLEVLDYPPITSDTSKVVEVEEMAELGVEVWDKYPPIDTVSRIADDFKYTIRLDELCDHVIDDLEVLDYPPITRDAPKTVWYRAERKERFDRSMKSSYDVYDLTAEREAIAKNSCIAEGAAIPI